MRPSNYFKIVKIDRTITHHSNGTILMTGKILAIFYFNDDDEETIKEAYAMAVSKLKRLMGQDNLERVRHDPKYPLRLRTWKPIVVPDFRCYRLLIRE